MNNRSSHDELPAKRTTNTQTFLETCVLGDDHKALEEHLVNNPVQQSDLDRCLLRRLQIVQRKEKELSRVAPTLTLLLQSGAKWNNDDLLADQKAPCHIICESPGDHHELLDLMIKSSQQTIVNTLDVNKRTPLMCAVENFNINCIKCLIANGEDVMIGDDFEIKSLTPIMMVIWMFRFASKHSFVVLTDIFNLLLDAAADQNKDHFKSCMANNIQFALQLDNVDCINILIRTCTPLNTICYDGIYVWASIAMKGEVELLKNMLNHGIDKNSIDQKGLSVLCRVILSGNVEAVRYVLELGVDFPNFSPEVREAQCEQCGENKLIIEGEKEGLHINVVYSSIWTLEMVKLLEEYGSENCKSFYTLRCAVIRNRVDVVSYLLNKYTYSLNMEYIIKDSGENIVTLLTAPSSCCNAQITKLLLDHGADPAKPMCSETSANATMTAINYGSLDAISQYIRSGINVNFRSWDPIYGKLSPLESSVLHDRHYISVMLRISGCSRGRFRTQKFKAKPKLKKLMKEWNVYDNNVIPLSHRCRCVILNHLSPRADLKIGKLPLPGCLIKFLSIPELDTILYEYNEANRR